jgi:drug/metabolite transporter (DMT)-like permease
MPSSSEPSSGAPVWAAEGPAPSRRTGISPAGCALVVVSALCYSSLGILGKVAFDAGMTVPSLMATRFVVATASLWAIQAAVPALRRIARQAPKGAGLFLWGGFGLAGQSALFFGSLKFVSASLAEVLLYTAPAWLALILWVTTRRRPPAVVLLAIACALGGTWLAAAPHLSGASRPGVLLGLAAGVWYAAFLLALARLSAPVHPWVATTRVVTGAACAWCVATLVTGYTAPHDLLAWRAIGLMVLLPTLGGFTLFVIGMQRTGPQIAAILSNFEPVGTLALAAVLLGERLRAGQWIGAALILAAAVILAARAPAGAASGAATEASGGASSGAGPADAALTTADRPG